MASLAVTLVDGILNEFGSLIASHSVPYFQFACCFKREWSKLENTLFTIRGIISDLEDKLEKTNAEKERLRRLEEILRDGRDLLKKPVDAKRNMADKVLNFFSTLWFYVVLPCKMKTIRERLNDAAKDHADFPGVDLKDQYIKSYKPPAFKTQATGREADKEAIRKRIKEYSNSDEANVSIIPIVAMGGMGKTTLAKLIYENEEDFRLKMWVDVSPDFDQKTLVEKVILAGTGKECEPNLGRDQLEQRLRNLLDGRKYMLVLDDVWETNPLRWDAFQHLLMGGARGSVILVTTRDREVGRITSNTGEPYILKSLSKDNSWSLFEQETCKCNPRLLEENPELRRVGEKILVECRGNPLAIKTVGGLLSVKGTYREWLDVKNQLWELGAEDIGILPSLKVSYDHLPSNLQKCFAHCALFPKGYKIKKTTLIQLWMAEEEFIQPSRKRILEDIGEEYFETLLNRNFFEDEKMDVCGNIKSCKMHDLMHDLAQTVAGMDNYSIIMNAVDGVKIPESVIHASISRPLYRFPTSILKAKNLRTFIIIAAHRQNARSHSTIYTDFSKEDFANFDLTFKSLRVLGLDGFCSWDDIHALFIMYYNVLNPIGKLKQLRYLDLSYSEITTLPNSVCELQNLQTLKLRECRHLTELPKDIKELKSLRHLENKRCDALKGIPCGIGQLTCIQTLSLFVLGEGAGLSELATLNNLRGYLVIQIRKNAATSVESRKAYLKGKQYLQTLKLDFSNFNGVEDAVSLEALRPNPNLKDLTIEGYGGVRFPRWMLKMGNSLPCLVQIMLFNCPRCVRFPLFADLPCLKELSLFGLDSLEYIDSYISDSSSSFSSSFKGRFPSLKKVYLQDLPKLKEWTRVVNDGRNAKTEAVAEQPTQQLLSLNSLEILEIDVCPELTSMPLHPNVEEMELYDVSGVLIESMTMAATVSPIAAATSFTFSKLKSLQIRHCKDQMSLGEGWLGNLTSLEHLEIGYCPELKFSDEDNDMPGLVSLHSLELSDLPKLAALPKVLQHSTALETLEIWECPGLMTLPDWVVSHFCEVWRTMDA
ncbi:hypothetical protein L1049_012282 [Liquidambar formosana]|uniref:NB-ARC domain-containing protein n=1 Tax=Liquidambar formosana TaxID=63359 RepID=A0AAP0RTF5_LIQFO